MRLDNWIRNRNTYLKTLQYLFLYLELCNSTALFILLTKIIIKKPYEITFHLLIKACLRRNDKMLWIKLKMASCFGLHWSNVSDWWTAAQSLTFYNRKNVVLTFRRGYFRISIVESLAAAQSWAVTLPTWAEVSGLKKPLVENPVVKSWCPEGLSVFWSFRLLEGLSLFPSL